MITYQDLKKEFDSWLETATTQDIICLADERLPNPRLQVFLSLHYLRNWSDEKNRQEARRYGAIDFPNFRIKTKI